MISVARNRLQIFNVFKKIHFMYFGTYVLQIQMYVYGVLCKNISHTFYLCNNK